MTAVAAFGAGFAFRLLRIAVESSLYLLIGFVVAGALRAWVGPARLRGWFGTGRWSGPLRGWLIGTILPVCSLGVLPVLAELRRSGVRRDAVLSFALAAPMLNPISLVVILSYLGPEVVGVLVAGAMLVTVALGGICRAEAVEPATEADPGPIPGDGATRLRAAAGFAARAAAGPILRDVAVGVAVACLFAACLTPGDLAEGVFRHDGWAIPRMIAVAVPSYLTPEKGVVALPEMLKFGQSPGAMFALLVLGVGMTAGHLSWIAREYGGRVLGRWLVGVLALTAVGAVAVDRLVPVTGTANSDNDHFEELANPFDPEQLGHAGTHVRRYLEHVALFHWATLAALLTLGGAGVALRRRRPTVGAVAVASDPTGPPEPGRRRSRLDAAVPARGVAAVLGLMGLAAAGVGALAFFPAPDEVFRDMAIIKADFFGEIGAATRAVPLHQLSLWDRQAARLPIGALLRQTPRTADAPAATAALRAGIGRLRTAIEADRPTEARAIFHQIQADYSRCRESYGVE